MLSGDSLFNIVPNPQQDTISDNTLKVVQEVELLHIDEHLEEKVSQHLDITSTFKTDVCQPIFTLYKYDNTNEG